MPRSSTRTDAEQRLGDRYRLGERLGAGGMAEVRAAEDERLGRPVAVKLLRTDLAGLDEARRRFEAEARAAAALVHPNIVAVFDVDEEATRPYLVMERLPGTTLADELARGPLDPKRVIDIGLQVLSALEAAHGAGIVHRDIKAGNILLAADGTWKVADFGIAKTTESLDVLTTPGAVMCTPGYVAPERLAGKPATAASDLYSVGVVLYEALAGRRPFVADTPIGVAHLTRTTDAPRLDKLRPGLDPELVRVVHRALARQPSRRFSDAAEMRAALAKADVGTRAVPLQEGAGDERAATVKVDPTRTRTVSPEMIRSAPRERRARPDWWKPRTLAWLLLGICSGLLVVVLVSSQNDTPIQGISTTPTTVVTAPQGHTPASSRLPAGLEDAIRRLEQEVRP